MFESLFGNPTVEKILLYLLIFEEAYPKRLADRFNLALNGIQQQLQRLEDGGIVWSEFKGKTRVYRFQPAYPLHEELISLLRRAFTMQTQYDLENYYKKEQAMPTNNLYVRALIVQNDALLVAHERNTTDSFLPGGRLEPGESHEAALARHLRQQFNGRIDVSGLAGVIESEHPAGSGRLFHTDLVFLVNLVNFDHPEYPRAQQFAFDYYWHPVKKLGQMNLQPTAARRLVEDAAAGNACCRWLPAGLVQQTADGSLG